MAAPASTDPKPIFPTLGRFYGLTSDIAYLVVRVTVGLALIPHGWAKVRAGVPNVSGYFARLHLEPSLLFTFVSMFNETIGDLLIPIGLFTRPIAALIIIEFLTLLFVVHIPRGYSTSVNGVEFPLFWLVAVFLRGGGPYSADRHSSHRACSNIGSLYCLHCLRIPAIHEYRRLHR